jgi:hypothetical protein
LQKRGKEVLGPWQRRRDEDTWAKDGSKYGEWKQPQLAGWVGWGKIVGMES